MQWILGDTQEREMKTSYVQCSFTWLLLLLSVVDASNAGPRRSRIAQQRGAEIRTREELPAAFRKTQAVALKGKESYRYPTFSPQGYIPVPPSPQYMPSPPPVTSPPYAAPQTTVPPPTTVQPVAPYSPAPVAATAPSVAPYSVVPVPTTIGPTTLAPVSMTVAPVAPNTAVPTKVPASQPVAKSSLPTKSSAPSSSSFAVTKADDEEGPLAYSQCYAKVPADASQINDQLISYTFQMEIKSTDSNDALSTVQSLEMSLHDQLADQYLGDCTYSNQEFYVYSVSSLPHDDVAATCAASDATVSCYDVTAYFRVDLFYRNSRRQLSEIISDPAILNSFGPFLKTQYEEGSLQESNSNITRLQFTGFTNVHTEDSTGPGSTTTARDDPGVAGAVQEQENKQEVSKGTLATSTTLVILAVICLVVVGAVAARRRQNAIAEIYKDFDDDELSEPSFKKHAPEITPPSYDDDDESLGPKVHVMSDDEMYETKYGETGYEVDLAFVPSEESKDLAPTFVSTGLQLSFDPPPSSPPRGLRTYVSPDTVVL